MYLYRFYSNNYRSYPDNSVNWGGGAESDDA